MYAVRVRAEHAVHRAELEVHVDMSKRRGDEHVSSPQQYEQSSHLTCRSSVRDVGACLEPNTSLNCDTRWPASQFRPLALRSLVEPRRPGPEPRWAPCDAVARRGADNPTKRSVLAPHHSFGPTPNIGAGPDARWSTSCGGRRPRLQCLSRTSNTASRLRSPTGRLGNSPHGQARRGTATSRKRSHEPASH